MGFRFQKRIRLFKYLKLNLSKSGASVSIGRPGMDVNIRGDKVTGNIGIPGTGLSYRERLDNPAPDREMPKQEAPSANPVDRPQNTPGWIKVLIVVTLFIVGDYLVRHWLN